MRKLKLKKVYIFFSSVLIFMLHLPFAFAKTKPVNTANAAADVSTTSVEEKELSMLEKVYDSLRLDMKGLSEQAYNRAIKGFQYLRSQGKLQNDNVISIADFTKPSSEKRLYVIDLKNYKVLFNTYVAHGQNSGAAYAKQFSNTPESLQSSPGFYRTSQTYNGKHGLSLHLEGLEQGINDKAYERAIVMHGAAYVSEGFIKQRGYIGRSWGCPAVPESLNKPIIEKIKNGTCLFIYSEDNKYLQSSKILNS
jgi:hypothetical protein